MWRVFEGATPPETPPVLCYGWFDYGAPDDEVLEGGKRTRDITEMRQRNYCNMSRFLNTAVIDVAKCSKAAEGTPVAISVRWRRGLKVDGIMC